MNLSLRLAAVAAMVPLNCCLADIGTDHAYLPLALVRAEKIRSAIATDIHRGPFTIAYDSIRRAALGERIEVRLGNGFEVIAPGEVDVAVLAGMGATTMIEIMESRLELVHSLTRIVFQPMTATALLRRWLGLHNFKIVSEDIVKDDERLYEVLAVEPGYDGVVDVESDCEIGYLLWQQRHPLLPELLDQRLYQLNMILNQMANSDSIQGSDKYQYLILLRKKLEARRKCL